MNINSLIQKFSGRKKAAGIAPPVLGAAVRFPYGPFQFKTQLPKGTAFIIQTTADLHIWKTLADGVAGAEATEYLDSEASQFSYRFYRLVAGEVHSTNVLGYASIPLPPGFSMIANPLDGPSNNVGDMFTNWPNGTTLHKFDTGLFKVAENSVEDGKWTNPTEKLMPGEGAIFFNPTLDYKSHSFVGEVSQWNLSIPIPAGFSLRSSIIPQPGSLDDLEFPIGEGDVIHLFDRDRQQYVLHPYEGGKWTAGTPVVSVGEAFWVAKTEAANWVRNFSIEA